MVASEDLQLLGPLQSKVMMAVWDRDICVAKDIHDELKKTYKNDIKYTTVVSTLNTLAKKGLINKVKALPAHQFIASLSLLEYQEYLVKEVCRMFYAGQFSDLHTDLKKLIR